MSGNACCRVIGSFFEYNTLRIVHIKNKKVGCLFRCMQLIVIAYIAGFVIAWKKGYQEFDNVESSTTSKLKGVGSTNYTALNITGPGGLSFRIWDVADYVIPPQENDAFFVMTNFIYTPSQSQNQCPEGLQHHIVMDAGRIQIGPGEIEKTKSGGTQSMGKHSLRPSFRRGGIEGPANYDPTMTQALCKNDSDCRAGEPIVNGNGVMTGRCVDSATDASIQTCEINAWCPVEIDVPLVKGVPLVNGSEEFTFLIKNNIVFNKFNTNRRNILDKQNSTYLQSCHFSSSHPDNKYCPVFRVGDVVAMSGVNNYSDIAVSGGVIVMNINWDCNLDHSVDECLPEYSFQRLDKEDTKIAKGTNFRFANYYSENSTMYRDLVKAYGILFLIKVTGQAGKFNIIPLLLNIGSGIGLLAVATVVSDFVLCYILKDHKFYFLKKYFYVNSIGEANRLPDDDPLLVVENDAEDDRSHSQQSHLSN